ncbi:DUF5959 family protein [Kitasatospora indigofera]|uniref:DUF5959 family protein n=1 Tax=Kitasatospora indigofera TaxID=67307 RepID=UPI0033AB8BA5
MADTDLSRPIEGPSVSDGMSLDLIRLADTTQSITVCVVLGQPAPDYFRADILIESHFVNAQVGIYLAVEDIEEWARVLDRIEGEELTYSETPLRVDWPSAGRDAYLRIVADDPYVVEVHDAPQTQIVVSVPLDLKDGWIEEARKQLTAARAYLVA